MKLMAHQKVTVELLQREPRVLDFSDPGTGKTLAHLYGIHKRGTPALVVAPKSLLDTAWAGDLEKFFPQMRYSIAWAECREEAFQVPAEVYLINPDAAKWLAAKPKRWFTKIFGNQPTLVIDESTVFKHARSERSKAMKKVVQHFHYREALTGTPNSNTITDIWHQVLLIDDGKRLGTRFSPFRNAVCYPEQVGPRPEHVRWVDKPMAEEAVAGLLADITVRHAFEDCIDIPESFERIVEYRPSEKLMRAYTDLEKEALLLLKEGEVDAINGGVLRNKLLQIASGAVYTNATYAVLDTGRYELIADLVEERSHSLVFFEWEHQRDGLIKEAQKRKLSFEVIDGKVTQKGARKGIVDKFQRGELQALFLHPETAAHGLTLTQGNTVIWASPTYRADHYKQGNHRVLRRGQKQKTEIIKIAARGTVEDIVYEMLGSKTSRMINFLDIATKFKEQRHEGKARKPRKARTHAA